MDKILIIEDDPDILNVLRECFTEIGMEIAYAADGKTGLAMSLAEDFSLVVLDLSLPGLGGMEVCRELRQQRELLPILILTSRTEEVDKVLGIELGADDYVTKPFSVRELSARVKALLRRSRRQPQVSPAEEQEASAEVLVRGELQIHLARHCASLGGKPLELTPAEYELLVILASNPGRAFTRQQLIEKVYGHAASECYATSVTAHLSRLRAKIEPDRTVPYYIRTVKGVGYRFAGIDELS